MSMNLIAYTRVSTADQALNGHGLDAQRAAIERHAVAHEWTIVEWTSDPGVSGAKIGPNLAQALDRCKVGEFDGIVVQKLDRMTRSAANFHRLLERSLAEGWTLIAIDPFLDLSTPTGRLFAGMLAEFAQYERELIRDRIRGGLAQAREKGKRLGGVPLLDAELVAEIRARRADGASYRLIADDLNARRVRSARGGRWYPSSVRWVVEDRKA